MQRVKRIRIQYYWVFRRHTLGGHTHFHSHMQISAHCVLQADRREFHFQAARAHQELSSACVHVWVCPAPRSCHKIFWPAESVMPELMCYTLNVRRSPEHLVTLLSREVSSFSASCCITAGCQTMWLQQAEINYLMLCLTRNKEWTFVQAPWDWRVQGGNERRHLGGATRKSRWPLSLHSDSVYRKARPSCCQGRIHWSFNIEKWFAEKGVWHLAQSHWFWRRG